MKIIPELLAPAGSIESLQVAINSGADAVYLSGKNFGARKFAANFSINEISEAVNYAHLRGVKVYVTVNTLVKNSELLPVAKYLLKLHQMGVDAMLVQDMGVMNIAQKLVPDLPLHASTQMTIHNSENLKWLEKNGFRRAVLSRELSLSEIKTLVKTSDLELEIFLHGALCYCYSGQCLLSSFIGGRSGNRGMCAQPCRKPYSLLYGTKDQHGRPIDLKQIELREKYLLSTRDLAHYPNLDLLVNSGVKSLKIEGRMRSPEYVRVVVSTYRQALDKIAKGKWKPLQKDIENLKMAFNREFTHGYLFSRSQNAPQDGTQNKIMAREKPGHRGLYIGDVKRIKGKKAFISLKTITIPQKGDGLFFDSGKEGGKNSVGFDLDISPVIKDKEMILTPKKPVKNNSKVYLTRRKDLFQVVSPVSNKKFNLKITFKVLENGIPELKGELIRPEEELEDKISSQIQGNQAMEKARKRPMSIQEIEKQLVKVGDKPFNVIFENSNYSGNLFLPLKELNQLRRDLIVSIENKMLQSHLPSADTLQSSIKEYNTLKKELKEKELHKIVSEEVKTSKKSLKENKEISISAYVDDIHSLKAFKNSDSNEFFKRAYLELPILPESKIYDNCLNSHNLLKFKNEFVEKGHFKDLINKINQSYDICRNKGIDLVWKWPDTTKEHVLNILKDVTNEISHLDMGVMVASPGIANYLAKKSEWKIYGSSSLNIWNNQSINSVSRLFSLLTLSPELSFNAIKSISNKNFEKRFQEKGYDVIPSLEIIVQGSLESIVSQECLLSGELLSQQQLELIKEKNKSKNIFVGLEDNKKQIFPLKLSPDCQTVLQNSVELCLVDYLPLLIDTGICNFSIDGRGRGAAYIKPMINYYENALNASFNSSPDLKIRNLKTDIKKISLGGITAGNFLRNVKKGDLKISKQNEY